MEDIDHVAFLIGRPRQIVSTTKDDDEPYVQVLGVAPRSVGAWMMICGGNRRPWYLGVCRPSRNLPVTSAT